MTTFFVASVTAFDAADCIDTATTRRLMEHHLSEGADGLFIGGSAGECFLQTLEERIRTFELAAAFGGQTEIYAHVGAISTREAVELARQAQALGIHRFAATPPFYFAFSDREVAGYYAAIAEAVAAPVLYYNIPMSTHRALDPDNPEVQALMRSGNLSGIKHTSLDLYQLERLRNLNSKLLCYGGFENCLLPFLAFGCDGFIGSTFNFMLPQYRRIAELYEQHLQEEALHLQTMANNILAVLMRVGLPAGLKYILRRIGLDVGEVRPPFLPLNAEQKQSLETVLEANLFSV